MDNPYSSPRAAIAAVRRPFVRRWVTGVVLGLYVVGITSVGVFFGYALDHSLYPPYGGGWRCYLGCVAAAWLFMLIPAGIVGTVILLRKLLYGGDRE